MNDKKLAGEKLAGEKLAGKRVLAFVGDIYEDLELWYPKLRLI